MKAINIMLVEDDADDAELTLHAFKSIQGGNRKLFHAWDGVQAIDYIFAKGEHENGPIQNNLNLIILDLKLPKVNGLEVLKAVREDPRTTTIPCVMFTSSKERRDIDEATDLGVNSYLVKPISFEEHVKTVEMLIHYWTAMNHTKATLF
jgi:two-component system response regulator